MRTDRSPRQAEGHKFPLRGSRPNPVRRLGEVLVSRVRGGCQVRWPAHEHALPHPPIHSPFGW